MNKRKAGVAFIVLLTCALAGQALAEGPEFKSNADDLAKIRSMLEEFRQDIIHKDGAKMGSISGEWNAWETVSLWLAMPAALSWVSIAATASHSPEITTSPGPLIAANDTRSLYRSK